MRVALYWVPARDDPLYAAGIAWLGRDAETGASVPQPPLDGIAAITADARRYGLHATLRPPMRLATCYAAFRAACHDVAQSCTSFPLPALTLCDIGGFLALREAEPCPQLHALCDRCVVSTENHRHPPDDADLTRRRACGLTARQEALLQRHGYPYVMAEWFFHVTLTGRLDAAAMKRVRPAAEAHFAAVLGVRRRVQDVCICTARDGDFLIAERLKFRQQESDSF